MKDKGLDRMETAGKRKRKELRLSALRRLITWARKMPFYKRWLRKVRTKDAVEDITKVPLLTKARLIRSMGKGRFPACGRTRTADLNIIGLTGGPGAEVTDGPKLPVPMRAVDMRRRGLTAARALRSAGELRGRTIMLEEISHNLVHQVLLRGLIEVGGVPVQLGRGFTLRHVRHTIPRLTPRNLVTYPTYALFLKDLLEKEGKALRLDKVFLWGEVGGSIGPIRKRISKAFGSKVFDVYAMQEFGVLAAECKAHRGLHGFEDQFIYEVVDPRTGEPVEDGERGELVVTELTRTAMPLIRYRTGDITSLERERCRCGRTHLRLLGIKGRTDQSLPGEDGSDVYAGDISELIVGNPHVTGAFKMVPGEGLIIETKEHREMTSYYLDKFGRPPLKIRFERSLPRFHHRTQHLDNERFHRLLKEQMRLEG